MSPVGSASAAPTVRVWSRWVRVLHWLLAASVLAAWASGHWPPERLFDEVHHTAGYVALAVVFVRLWLGFAGDRLASPGASPAPSAPHARPAPRTPYVRFAQFVRGPRATLHYARQLLSAQESRHIGHNPLGAWMVLALLVSVAGASVTGFLYTTDWLWGYGWLAQLHAALAWMLTVLVPWHLAGVALASKRHRENLVAAMIHGRKRAPGTDDID